MDLESGNRQFLTPEMQSILLDIYRLGEITFDKQSAYKNERWFRDVMERLQKFGKVEKEIRFVNGGRRTNPHYKLNPAGKILVEMFIIAYNDRVNR